MDTNQETCCGEEAQPLLADSNSAEQELEFLLNKETRSQERFAICQTCPELSPKLNMCSQCNCFMQIKTRIFWAKCPLSKW